MNEIAGINYAHVAHDEWVVETLALICIWTEQTTPDIIWQWGSVDMRQDRPCTIPSKKGARVAPGIAKHQSSAWACE